MPVPAGADEGIGLTQIHFYRLVLQEGRQRPHEAGNRLDPDFMGGCIRRPVPEGRVALEAIDTHRKRSHDIVRTIHEARGIVVANPVHQTGTERIASECPFQLFLDQAHCIAVLEERRGRSQRPGLG